MTDTPGAVPERDGPSPIAIGAILVLAGIVLFAGNLAGIGIEDVGWPVIVIAAGLGILFFGLAVVRESGVVVGGTSTTVVGLVLLYQDRTDRWESWAYAWALVGPAASGLGLVLWGLRTGNRHEVRNGTWAFLGGLGMFAIGFLFFEGLIGISGQRMDLPEWLLPGLIIAFGLVVLVRGILDRGEPAAS